MVRINREPWKTVVRECIVASEDTDAMVAEVLTTDVGKDLDAVEEMNVIDRETTPTLWQFVQDVVVKEMLRYVQEVWDYTPKEWSAISWVRCTTDGSDLEVHHHATPVLSAVYYLEGRAGDLSLLDPRGCAERGLPSEIRKHNFGTYHYQPGPGCLIIFPSYLHHYVSEHSKALRIAIPTDLYFK